MIEPTAASSGADGWADSELATLAAVAETFVRGAAQRRARLAAQAVDAGLDPAQVRQIRFALRAFESRLANLFLTGRPTRFRDLEPDAREQYLLTWGRSRLALRRSAFQALKKLLCFLAYADPGDPPPNPLLLAMGYRPAQEPVTSEPTPIQPVDLGLNSGAPHQPIELDADVVIVGSGAGGGVVAAALAGAGRSVVVLEAGAFVPEPEMPTDELSAYDRLYLDHGLTATWDGSVTILAGGTVGGGTVVNWTTCIAPPDALRTEWTRDHGLEGFDGAEVDDDLATLDRELSISDPPNVPPKDEAILRGASALGLEHALTRRNAVDCGDCGSCPFGCRRGAKQSGLRVHLATASRAGARIIPNARVERVLIDRGRAVGVEGLYRSPTGQVSRRFTFRAPQVVLAAGALRTPTVLERSGLDHPSIGRHLRLHPVPVIGADYDEPAEIWRGTMQAARSLAFLDPESGHGFAIESAPGHPGLFALAFPWESAASHAAIMARARWKAPLIAICRDTGEGGRVRARPDGRARIDYSSNAVDAATLRRALVEMARIARAAGAREIVAFGLPALWHTVGDRGAATEEREFRAFLETLSRFDFAPNRGLVFSAHQMGTARMGGPSADHPCDPRGRVRSGARRAAPVIRGLYVADASLFPTALGVNPMITVMALARRVARTVLAEATASS